MPPDRLFGLPNPFAASSVPDTEVGFLNSPHWGSRKLEFQLSVVKRTPPETIHPEHFIKSVSLETFPHIDSNVRGCGASARTICGDMSNADIHKQWGDSMKVYYGGATFNSAITPLSGPLFEKGPYDLCIKADKENLIIVITAESTPETAQITIPKDQIRRRTVSYLDFIADNLSSTTQLRRNFDQSRKNQHSDHAAYIAEKFAQQGWYLGYKQASLLFELTGYLLTPTQQLRLDGSTPKSP